MYPQGIVIACQNRIIYRPEAKGPKAELARNTLGHKKKDIYHNWLRLSYYPYKCIIATWQL